MTELDQVKFDTLVDGLDDDMLQYVAQSSFKWSSPTRVNDSQLKDADGFPVVTLSNLKNFGAIQKKCWEKYNENPQINSHVRDVMGSMTGYGFNMSSENLDINSAIEEITYDIRNELFKNIPKYVGRAEIEGELFLACTVHTDGFVEVDFMDPSTLNGEGDSNSGIYFHPNKGTMPLFYSFKVKNTKGTENKDAKTKKINGSEETVIFPSIYTAYMPELGKIGVNYHKINTNLLKKARSTKPKYKVFGGYKTFIVAWDRGLLTKRNVSHIRTTLEWIEHYENLKKWEIDHKKSAGSYLWVVSLTDSKAFRTWLKMTDEQKAETGLTAKKTPGGTLILPPGVEIDVKNPNLPNISEQDTDIMHMVTSGLNKPEDMVTGQTKGDTFSGVKASRGPQSDRTQDQIANLERFLRYDFWRGIFFLKSKMSDFKLEYKVKEAVEFVNKKPKFKNVMKQAHDLIDFEYPTSEVSDVEAKARALLGVKHPSIVEVLGIPKEVVAKKLGFAGYKKYRLQYATEESELPELPNTAELDSMQEKAGEPTLPKKEELPKKEPVKKDENKD